MASGLIENLIHTLKGTPPEVAVFLISMLPIVELRGAIPAGVIYYGFPPLKSFLISVIGNTIAVLPILFFLEPIHNFLSKFYIFRIFFEWLFKRTKRKAKNIEKYGAIALALFVAIPLPMTGAWTGSIAAVLFDIHPKYSIPAIIVGVTIAGIIVVSISFGLNSIL